jgi:hypothetical protein
LSAAAAADCAECAGAAAGRLLWHLQVSRLAVLDNSAALYAGTCVVCCICYPLITCIDTCQTCRVATLVAPDIIFCRCMMAHHTPHCRTTMVCCALQEGPRYSRSTIGMVMLPAHDGTSHTTLPHNDCRALQEGHRHGHSTLRHVHSAAA